MTRTTVLFLCPDNSLLGPLAEAYLNHKTNGLIRAFSAGIEPADQLNRHVSRLLSSDGLDARGLGPKSVDVFRLPHSVVPDWLIYLVDMNPIAQPQLWAATTTSHWWNIAQMPRPGASFAQCVAQYLQIRKAIDELVDPPRTQPWPLAGWC